MKLKDFYRLAIAEGLKKDVRPKAVLKKLGRQPYADSAILYGAMDIAVQRILVGIDIDGAELILAERLRQDGGLDLVVSHHPEGKAWATFYKVMSLQVEMLKHLGLPEKSAKELLEKRQAEVARRVSAANHSRSVDIARILDMPFMCLHTPADNFAYAYVNNLLNKKKIQRVGDILDVLAQVPEYRMAIEENNPPKIISGASHRQAGKIYVEMTGGTEGPKKAYSALYKKGVRTLVCMHLSEEHFNEIKDKPFNVVIAGHIASDTLGLNLLLDAVEKRAKEELRVVNCAGFRRVRRHV